MYRKATALIFFLMLTQTISSYSGSRYLWRNDYDPSDSVESRIPVPEGFRRIDVDDNSFARWLRRLPLKNGRPDVMLYNGRKKSNQDAHYAVIDIDVGSRNLQQCADAVIRLRSEYLLFRGEIDDIHFNFTSGDNAKLSRWFKGIRPRVSGNNVKWVKSAEPQTDYSTFREYLETVFMYAGSYSLSKELVPVGETAEMRIGDVFIEGGFPGHAVIIVDMAENPKNGKKIFMAAQSYMPAQDIHIVKNPENGELSPWYSSDIGNELVTPLYTFHPEHLKRFD